MKKYKVMLVSGGFDPVHKGHLEMIAQARELADEVWVILNNEDWLIKKKGQAFMSEEERSYIMSQVKGVTHTIICDPRDSNDRTVVDGIYSAICHYKRNYSPDNVDMAFGNGGDRGKGNVPEEEYCNTMNIDCVWNLGSKVQSSSWLLEKYSNKS